MEEALKNGRGSLDPNSSQEDTKNREQCLGIIQFYQETKTTGIMPLGCLSSSLSALAALRSENPVAQGRGHKGPPNCTLKARGQKW